MSINAISAGFQPIGNLSSAANAESAHNSNNSFGSLVKDTLESLNSGQKQAEHEIARAVTGESPDLHKTIVALQTADLQFQLGLQARNKLVGAYEEIMRMQV